jgi:hypothetical protein
LSSSADYCVELIYTDVFAEDDDIYLVTTRDELVRLCDRLDHVQPRCEAIVITDGGARVYAGQTVSVSVSGLGYALSFRTPVAIEFRETRARVSLDACRTANLAATLQQYKAAEGVGVC